MSASDHGSSTCFKVVRKPLIPMATNPANPKLPTRQRTCIDTQFEITRPAGIVVGTTYFQKLGSLC